MLRVLINIVDGSIVLCCVEYRLLFPFVQDTFMDSTADLSFVEIMDRNFVFLFCWTDIYLLKNER